MLVNQALSKLNPDTVNYFELNRNSDSVQATIRLYKSAGKDNRHGRNKGGGGVREHKATW